MNNKERSTSLGTVIAFGFILLGILSMVGSRHYRKATFSAANIIPGLLFISIGVTILIIKAIRKTRE